MKLTNFKSTDTFLRDQKSLHIKDGYLVSDTQAPLQETIDCQGLYIFPGFFDLQLYGASGYVFDNDPSMECLGHISEEHGKYGTTDFLITLPSTSIDTIRRAVAVVREAMASGHTNVRGLHLEGPFLNPAKKGAHNEAYIKVPELKYVEEIMDLGKGVIKMITIAPELWSDALLTKLKAYDVKVSVGHSNASYAEARRAFSMGIDCCTHLYNAMSPMESRAAGVVGACLTHDDVWATVVVDGKHVCYETLAITLRLKPSRLILISDATFLNVQENTSSIGGVEVQKRDGAFYTLDGRLAGSSIALSHAVKNCISRLNVPLEIAVDMASTRPAAFLAGTARGKLQIGQRASMVLLDADGTLKGVLVAGVWKKQLS